MSDKSKTILVTIEVWSKSGHMTIYAASFDALTEPWLFPMP